MLRMYPGLPEKQTSWGTLDVYWLRVSRRYRGGFLTVITIPFSWKVRELSCGLINNEEKGVYMFSPSWVSRSICPIPLPGNT